MSPAGVRPAQGPRSPLPSVVLLALTLVGSGCAVRMARPSAAGAEQVAVLRDEKLAAQPLQRSLFSRDPAGQLGEEALQKILAAPWEMAMPARVGVVPIVAAQDPRGPAPSSEVPAAAGLLARELRGEPFTLVTEVMAIPSGALGMEALRELAARYRLRYLVLFREEIGGHRFANGWASLYATGIGAFFIPGETLRSTGYVEASLFDVKTGLLLATVRRPVFEERNSTVWGTDEKLAAAAARLSQREIPALARELRGATMALATAAREEVRQRAEQRTATVVAP